MKSNIDKLIIVPIQSEDVQRTISQLPRHLDYDHLQSRAQKYERENYFNKLLEISLQFDLGDYEKSMSFDGLVVFYCESIFCLP